MLQAKQLVPMTNVMDYMNMFSLPQPAFANNLVLPELGQIATAKPPTAAPTTATLYPPAMPVSDISQLLKYT